MIVPIRTPRLEIRRFQNEDLASFVDFMTDERSTKYLMFDDSQKTKAGATGLFNAVVKSYDSQDQIHSYAIADRRSGTYVGSCGYSPYAHGIVEIYYAINREFTGQGLAKEATKELVGRLAKHFEVRAYCSPDNEPAHAVALASGLEDRGLDQHISFGVEGRLFALDETEDDKSGGENHNQ
ncbi:MAG: N-acetyltransferase [Acidobacteria bacterium]|nr:MAG: N-acetyltransferase [Acidobacteriota bacterium]REK02377.1 MAG: N-acetyltransferase [Acidobacteriota bacterium]REK15408.1 MAG: N-acetyltransferase [Acidobacteriota bacterium]REK41816.1 MAG: N-acetyltransferase [Acidobacteriota bacterium]